MWGDFFRQISSEIYENNGFLICESCGIEIKIERSNESDNKLNDNSKSNITDKKKPFYIRIYENIRNYR